MLEDDGRLAEEASGLNTSFFNSTERWADSSKRLRSPSRPDPVLLMRLLRRLCLGTSSPLVSRAMERTEA